MSGYYFPETCRKWSLARDRRFTGLCSMVMQPITANKTGDCEICVTPLEPAEPPEPVYPDPPYCRTWFVQRRFFGGLCAMPLHPVVGDPACPICAIPVEPVPVPE